MSTLMHVLAAVGAIAIVLLAAYGACQLLKGSRAARAKTQQTEAASTEALAQADEEELAAVIAAAAMVCMPNETVRKITRITPRGFDEYKLPILSFAYTIELCSGQ